MQNDQALPVVGVDLQQLNYDVLPRRLQIAIPRNAGDEVEHGAFPASFDEIPGRLPLEEREGDPEGVLPMLEQHWLQELVVVGELQLDFGQVLLEVDLDDALQHVLLLLSTQLAVLENLRKHNYNTEQHPQST